MYCVGVSLCPLAGDVFTGAFSLLLSWACPSSSGGSFGDQSLKRGLGIYLREGGQLHRLQKSCLLFP